MAAGIDDDEDDDDKEEEEEDEEEDTPAFLIPSLSPTAALVAS